MCLKVLIFFNLTNECEIKFVFFICAKERMLEFKVLMLHGVYVSVSHPHTLGPQIALIFLSSTSVHRSLAHRRSHSDVHASNLHKDLALTILILMYTSTSSFLLQTD